MTGSRFSSEDKYGSPKVRQCARLRDIFRTPGRALAREHDVRYGVRPVGGLGLHIVRELADEADYSRRDGRNVIRLSRRVSSIKTSRS
jgi:hypothetical protein